MTNRICGRNFDLNVVTESKLLCITTFKIGKDRRTFGECGNSDIGFRMGGKAAICDEHLNFGEVFV